MNAMPNPIYLDYNATTPVDPVVADAIAQSLRDDFGNPSSSHSFGRIANAAIEKARGQVAALIGAEPDEIVFTGGGTEATNHAIMGACQIARPASRTWRDWVRNWNADSITPDRCHIITTTVEHPATLHTVDYLRRLGASVTFVEVDRHGLPDLREFRASSFGTSRRIFSVMHSNNETGTLMPIREIVDVARQSRLPTLIHTDCAQSLGKVAVNVKELGVDLLTIAGHKLYAPKGIGALYIRRGVKLEPLIHGAGHESGRRAGTENTPYIVGLGVAAELARESLPTATEKLKQLRDRLYQKLLDGLPGKISLNGHPELRLPNTLNINFHGHIGPQLLAKVPEIAASNGAACHETKHGMQFTPSAVLCAMRIPPSESIGAVRLTVGRYTTEAEVDRAAELLIHAAKQA